MTAQSVSTEHLRWVVCPVCHSPLEREADRIACMGCDRRYPIVDGIPVLLAERAVPKPPV